MICEITALIARFIYYSLTVKNKLLFPLPDLINLILREQILFLYDFKTCTELEMVLGDNLEDV